MGQNLRQADITNTNISEVLRIYLTARGQAEVKLMHNRNPPEMLHAKDPRRILEDTPENIQDYNDVLKKTKGKSLLLKFKTHSIHSLCFKSNTVKKRLVSHFDSFIVVA